MKGLKFFAALVVVTLVLCPICLAHADMQEGSGAKHEGSATKEADDMSSKPPCKPAACMGVMLKKHEDRVRIVDEMLKDEATRNILMQRIADDDSLQKELMQKMKEKKHGEGSMMKHEDMQHGEGSMMKHEDMQHGEGSTMKHEGSASKE